MDASSKAPRAAGFFSSRWPVRAGVALVVAIYVAYSLFGVAAPFLWGHHGYHGATYMLRAVMSLRFHLLLPCTWAGYDFPPRFSWYLHHPIGYHHLLTALIPIFGVHEWVARGAAAATGLGVIWALFALVRHYWSREAALLAIAVWVALPIVTTFSVLSDAMFPAMTCSIVVAYAFLRYQDEASRRWLVVACLFTVLGGLVMWEAYFQAFFHGLFAMALLATRRGRARRLGKWNAYLAWTFWTGLVSSVEMALHFLYTWSKGMLADLRGSYAVRSNAAYEWAFDRQKGWLDVLYGWPLLKLGALWLLLFVARAAMGRARRRDQAVLIFFVLNSFYLWIFVEAAAVHEYRVFFYSSFFCLAVTDLASDLHAGAAWLLRARPALSRPVAATLTALAVAGYFALEAPHAWKNLIDSRVTMGTHVVGRYDPDYSKQLFAMELARRTGPDDFVLVHNNMPRRIEFYYYMDRSNQDIATLAQVEGLRRLHPRLLVALDVAALSPLDRPLLVRLLREHPGFIFDHYLLVDLRSARPGIREYRWQPQPSTPAYRYFVSHHYPPMKAVETATMQSACLSSQAGVAPPPDAPAPPEPLPAHAAQAVCYYNWMQLRGDAAGAAAFLAKLRALPGALGRDVPLGEATRVLAVVPRGRAGADVYLRVEKPPVLPAATVLRFRTDRVADAPPAPGRDAPPPLIGEQPAAGDPPITTLSAGALQLRTLSWSLSPGTYRLRLEWGLPAPPAVLRPAPSRERPTPPLAPGAPRATTARPLQPSSPAPVRPPPFASAELGTIEIR